MALQRNEVSKTLVKEILLHQLTDKNDKMKEGVSK